MSITINKDQCMGCGNCMAHCPKHLLQLSNDYNRRNVHYITLKDTNECIECGRCELMCTAAALHTDKIKSGHYLLDQQHIPPHTGCYLGSLAKALADAIEELNITDKVVLFKKKAADVNLHVKSFDYTDDNFYQDGLDYKQQHPESIVVIICSSSKVFTTATNEERYRALTDEKITIINTLNWFESDPEITTLTKGESHILEEMAQNSQASFVARSSVRTPQELLTLKRYIKQALTNQINGLNFSIVEMTFPCFYRLSGRPQTLMSYEPIHKINQFFDSQIKPLYKEGIYKQ